MNGSTVPTLWLNSMSLSPNSFLISLTSAAVSGHAHPFVALVDSGSSHCFVDYDFAKWNKLPMTNLDKKIPLQLFDGSTLMTVSKKTSFPITFPTSENHAKAFFITKLNQGYSAVLGYNWLVQHNPVIDWVETKVMFPNHWTEPKDNGPSKVNV